MVSLISRICPIFRTISKKTFRPNTPEIYVIAKLLTTFAPR